MRTIKAYFDFRYEIPYSIMADLLTTCGPAARRTAALCCVLALFLPGDLFAQASDSCVRAVEEAEREYVEGRFDAVLSTLSVCMGRDDVRVVHAVAAYRLTALAHIRKGDVEEARLSVIELLSRMPDYEPDPIRDIPSYVALVSLAKQELQLNSESSTVAQDIPDVEEDRPRSWFRSNRGWLIAGGSAAMVGIVTAVALGGGGGGPPVLPGPPTLPE